MRPGGAEKFVYELSNQLNTLPDVECHVATLYPKESNTKFKLDESIYIGDFEKKTGLDFRCLYRVYKSIKRNQYQVVHAHVNAILYILFAVILLPNVRFVATIHSDAYFEAPTKLDKLVRKILFKLLKVRPVTISEESNKSFVALYGLNAPIIYNGISAYSHQETNSHRECVDEKITFIHPASCQPIKNQQLLFKAFSQLALKYKNVELLWFGSNTTNQVLFQELSNFFTDNIRYCGCVEDMREYLASADAMCLSSLKEGMPMTIIEAFSVGCVPIVTPAGGCVNMINDGINGFVSSNFDVDNYYAVLEKFVLLSPSEKNEMKISCIESYNQYTIESCAERYQEIYRS